MSVSTIPFTPNGPSPARHTGIVRVFLLPNSLNRTIERREQTTPDTEVTTKNRCSCLDGCDCAYPSLSVGAVPETFDTVPDRATNSLEDMNISM